MTTSFNITEETFYEKKFYFSYSSLNKLLYCPEIFYKEYVLGDRETRDESYLTEGRLIHCLLLEPKKFEDQFIVMTGKMPSENTKIVVDRVFEHHKELEKTGGQKGTSLADYRDAVIDILLDINLHQKLTTDDQRFAKIYTPDANIYWDFLNKSKGKQIVDTQMHEKCVAVVEKIKSNSKISNLLQINRDAEWWSTTDVFNEIPLEMDLKRHPFGIKGVVDNLVIDPINKIIRINDFKTTSKTLSDFKETILFYNYQIQAAVYNLLVINKYSDLIAEGYKIEFRFIVVDKNQQVHCFMISPETMKEWMSELQEVLTIASYHYVNKDYTLPYIFTQNEETIL